jgi:hypothetical protein
VKEDEKPGMEQNDNNEPLPPNAPTVARRALVLAAVACRAFIDDEKNDPKGAAKLAKRSFDWLRTLGLDADLTDWERKILCTKFGCLEDHDRMNASWLAEGLVVLAWALKCADLPAFDIQCDPSATANTLGYLQPRADTVLTEPRLHSSDELAEYNEFVYNLHWRTRNFSLNHSRYDFESLARKAWGEPVLRFGLKLCERDIKLGDGPLFKAKGSSWRRLASITQERHRASNWLIGYASENFYEVTTDT